MKTILLNIKSIYQSWGKDGCRYSAKKTFSHPTKSGIIGLLGAILGISREDRDSLKKLNNLKMAIRIEKQGVLIKDYQIIGSEGGVYRSSGAVGTNVTCVKEYLENAHFLVSLYGDEVLLKQIISAIKCPKFQYFFGRKCCVPSEPLLLTDELFDLDECSLLEKVESRTDSENFEIIYESEDGVRIQDVALDFSPKNRQYTFRYINRKLVSSSDFSICLKTKERIKT